MQLSLCLIVVLALCHTSIGCPWTAISGKMRHITVTPNYVWASDVKWNVYRCVRPCNGHFIHDSGAKLFQIDADDYELYGIGRGYHVYRRAVDGSGGWAKLPGGRTLHQISASGLGYLWGRYKCYVYTCKKPCRGQWVHHSTPRAIHVEANGDRVYVVDRHHRIFTMPVDGVGVWKQIKGSLRYITASTTMVYGIDRHHKFYSCKAPCLTGEWKNVAFDGGQMLQCDATFKTLFAISTSQTVYRYEE